jgi:hypothetical protein
VLSGLTELRTPTAFVDARAADLRLSTGPLARVPVRAALASRPGPRLGGYALELRVLGASHQVLLRSRNTTWVETLACDAEQEPLDFPLNRADEIAPGVRHTLTARLTSHRSRAGFAGAAGIAGTACQGHTAALVVRFDGDPLAFTAVGATAYPDALHWQTWHLYPQTGEIVSSESVVMIEPEVRA